MPDEILRPLREDQLAPARRKRFLAEDRVETLRSAKIGIWTVILMVPACTLLDMGAYPDHIWSFLALRILSSISCLPLLWMVNEDWGRKHYRVFPVLLPTVPAIAIGVMIYLTGDAKSEYYAGLTLCIVASSFVFHWTYRELALTLGVIFSVYLAATLPNLTRASAGLFLNNTIFLLLNCIVMYVSSRHHHTIRVREFSNRCQVEDQRSELVLRNQELTDTLRLLSETRAQLDHSEKLASIGRLTAGIIHEVNNPLNYMKTALHLLKKKAVAIQGEAGLSMGEIVADLSEGLNRVAAIVSDLRSFSHPESRPTRPVNLTTAVTKALRFISKEAHDHGVDLRVSVPEDIAIMGDESHLVQILINLIQNSIDALEGLDTPVIVVEAAQTPEAVTLTITDNGRGMPEEVINKIFDPFFTTKEVGKGMGLGLSLCYRMMQHAGGDITVESAEGEFTQFTLTFRPGHPMEGHLA